MKTESPCSCTCKIARENLQENVIVNARIPENRTLPVGDTLKFASACSECNHKVVWTQ